MFIATAIARYRLLLHLGMNTFLFLLPLLLFSATLSSSAPQVSSAIPPLPLFAAPSKSCSSGVSVMYTLQSLVQAFPLEQNPLNQPYAFSAILEIFNAGEEDVEGWEVFIGYVNREILVSSGGALVGEGSQLPANASAGITLTSPNTVLKTGIDTAMDYAQMGVRLILKGTEFGNAVSSMPDNIALVNPGYQCSRPLAETVNTITTCCIKVDSTRTLTDNKYLPRYKGDITISYDVVQAYADKYMAQVTMSNDSPAGRLDFWKLQWTWQHGEFIYSMRGAQTMEQEQSDCLFGPAGNFYAETDFSHVMSCEATPTIIDHDQYKANDSNVGKLEYCCRNGTLLPATQDPSKAKAVFQLLVFKLPPQNKNSTLIHPPANWRIAGSFDADYVCDQPRLVQPTRFPDPASSQRREAAVLTWQVTCNATNSPPKCCVSFSAYYNDSVAPCRTCACGCPSKQTCNSTAQALFVPLELAAVPFANRTAGTLAHAHLNDLPVPQILPCPDNCGVSINWHLVSAFTDGWTARITLFNWQGLQFAEWSAAVELVPTTFSGFQKAYSFNYSTPGNTTIFMFGLEGLNYLNGIYDNYPGIQQSVLSFNKDVSSLTARDYFPIKVFFDGNECVLPDVFLSGGADVLSRVLPAFILPLLLLGSWTFGLLLDTLWFPIFW